MILLGLTGGIGMGKSTVGQLLAGLGAYVVDTDQIARDIVEPGQPALDEIRTVFGPDILEASGRLRRDELARRVFSNPELRLRLEAILHPRIRQVWSAQADRWRSEGRALAVVVIPLLFETNAANQFDATLCVACSGGTQSQRLHARGWSASEIGQRIEAQWPIDRKVGKSDFVIWTEGSIPIATEQLKRILALIG